MKIDSFENIHVEADPYFEDWMTASTTENINLPEDNNNDTASNGSDEGEDGGITILSSDQSSICDDEVASIHSIDTTSGNNNDNNVSMTEQPSSEFLLSSIDTSPENSPFPPTWQQQRNESSALSMSTAESMYQEAKDADTLSSLSGDSYLGGSMMSQSSNDSNSSASSSSSSSSSSLSSDGDHNDDESAENNLSLTPSSVPSSQLAGLPSIVSADSRNLTLASLGIPPRVVDELTRAYYHQQQQQRMPAASMAPQSSGQEEQGPFVASQNQDSHLDGDENAVPEWFAAIQTDQDWESWRNDMLQVLAVLGEEEGLAIDYSTVDPTSVDPDLLLAALLSQQEDFMLAREANRRQESSKNSDSQSFWKGVAAVVASAVVPVTLAVIAGRRRAVHA